jgi:catechol 2,3-dioxygenase-like lactoylglutathione lyase family enzyme
MEPIHIWRKEMEIKFISAVIMVKDVKASREFYEGLLGQRVSMDHGPNVAFEGGFAIWQKDHASEIIFNQPHPAPIPAGCHAMEIYFETENLDEIRDKIAAKKIEFVHDLIEQPWGQRVLRVYDPDGAIVEVGEPMSCVIIRLLKAGLDEEEIVKHTSMPLVIIQQIAAAFRKEGAGK